MFVQMRMCVCVGMKCVKSNHDTVKDAIKLLPISRFVSECFFIVDEQTDGDTSHSFQIGQR